MGLASPSIAPNPKRRPPRWASAGSASVSATRTAIARRRTERRFMKPSPLIMPQPNRGTMDGDLIARHAPGRPGDGPDDERVQPAVPPALSGARRTGDDERDGGRAPAEAEAARRVRPHPARARRTVLRR